jgi:hypothetical protein
LFVCACASSSSAPPATANGLANTQQPALPHDPLELVIGGPESLVTMQVSQLRSSPLFPRIQPYLQRAICAQGEDWQALLEVTTRAELASRSQAEAAEQWLLVLEGKYTPADAPRLLHAAAEHMQQGSEAPRDGELRGFKLSEQGPLSASALSDRLLVLGHSSWVRAAIDALGRAQDTFAATPLWRELGASAQCDARAMCVLSTANGSGAQQLQRGLAGLGAGGLGAQLGAADSVLSLSVPDGAELSFVARLHDAEGADGARRELERMVTQVGLLTRLTGLPDVLSATRLTASENVLHADLAISASDLAAYEQRAGGLIEKALPGACE